MPNGMGVGSLDPGILKGWPPAFISNGFIIVGERRNEKRQTEVETSVFRTSHLSNITRNAAFKRGMLCHGMV